MADLNAILDEALGHPVARPIRWDALQSDEYAAELYDLGSWVSWLVLEFALDHREVPPCWYRHRALVQELSALRGSWQVAYDPAQTASAAADWHLTFHYARLRLKDWAARTGCKPGEHRDDTAQQWAQDYDAAGWTDEVGAYLDSTH